MQWISDIFQKCYKLNSSISKECWKFIAVCWWKLKWLKLQSPLIIWNWEMNYSHFPKKTSMKWISYQISTSYNELYSINSGISGRERERERGREREGGREEPTKARGWMKSQRSKLGIHFMTDRRLESRHILPLGTPILFFSFYWCLEDSDEPRYTE